MSYRGTDINHDRFVSLYPYIIFEFYQEFVIDNKGFNYIKDILLGSYFNLEVRRLRIINIGRYR